MYSRVGIFAFVLSLITTISYNIVELTQESVSRLGYHKKTTVEPVLSGNIQGIVLQRTTRLKIQTVELLSVWCC